jgi:hypothetical protein
VRRVDGLFLNSRKLEQCIAIVKGKKFDKKLWDKTPTAKKIQAKGSYTINEYIGQ